MSRQQASRNTVGYMLKNIDNQTTNGEEKSKPEVIKLVPSDVVGIVDVDLIQLSVHNVKISKISKKPYGESFGKAILRSVAA